MDNLQLLRLLDQAGIGMTEKELEVFREVSGGSFGVTPYKIVSGVREQVGEQSWTDNLVTNEGLAHILGVGMVATADIATWYCTTFTTNTTPLATHTYASPGGTEVTNAAAGVTETVRQTWTGGSLSGTTTASVDNSAAVATYTAGTSGITLYGAWITGGGTNAFGHVASGTLYASSLFSTSKVLASTDTLDITYTLTATDDGA